MLFAEEIASQKDSIAPDRSEAAARTVISRAYYGSFLQYREHLLTLLKSDATLGPQFETLYTETEMHGIVVDVLKVLNYALGSGLGDLRFKRNDADYALARALTWKSAEECLGLAKSILAEPSPTEDRIYDSLKPVASCIAGYYNRYISRRASST